MPGNRKCSHDIRVIMSEILARNRLEDCGQFSNPNYYQFKASFGLGEKNCKTMLLPRHTRLVLIQASVPTRPLRESRGRVQGAAHSLLPTTACSNSHNGQHRTGMQQCHGLRVQVRRARHRRVQAGQQAGLDQKPCRGFVLRKSKSVGPGVSN